MRLENMLFDAVVVIALIVLMIASVLDGRRISKLERVVSRMQQASD